MEVTKLEPYKGRVRVHLDGRPKLQLTKSIAYELAIGEQISDDRLRLLEERDQRERAYQRTKRWLVLRPRSEAEIRIRLARNKIVENDRQSVVDRLRDEGLVDDEAFAAAWIENRMAFRPRGAFALRSELRAKGVSQDIIDSMLEGFDEEGAAEAAAAIGARKYTHLSQEVFRKRLGAYLSRRGFSYSVSSPLVERHAAELSGESEEEG